MFQSSPVVSRPLHRQQHAPRREGVSNVSTLKIKHGRLCIATLRLRASLHFPSEVIFRIREVCLEAVQRKGHVITLYLSVSQPEALDLPKVKR